MTTKAAAQADAVQRLVTADLPSLRRLDDLIACLHKRGYRYIHAEYLAGQAEAAAKEKLLKNATIRLRIISPKLHVPKRIMCATNVDPLADRCWIEHCLNEDLKAWSAEYR